MFYNDRSELETKSSKAHSYGLFELEDKPTSPAVIYLEQQVMELAPPEQRFSSAMMQEIEMNTNMIRERDEQITSITRSLEELGGLFRDINTTVVEQVCLICLNF